VPPTLPVIPVTANMESSITMRIASFVVNWS
jgi:hypothetical protein